MEESKEQGNKYEDEQQREGNQHEEKKNWLEWTVFGISLLLVLAILGYLGYQTYTRKPSTPDLIVQSWPDPTNNSPNRYHIQLKNKGGTTAETVIIELALMKGGKEVEKAQLQIDFAPQESKREGWVGFRSNPGEADTLISRVVSYKKP
ncbi:uncharacterized protein (TIGR02588 family) [Pontibacter aydingkolensis]|uniref:TIGR02588 family protein n=1 Tax=Pontibacter aydingkolensis TaxID=1911536 RepID=A0ABS7CY34_9BACT|nr:hypothetical protein [Pontibacter aydingkolensis]MBW7468690.1 hypothetical protein [Pontibacter aydingkolensis]